MSLNLYWKERIVENKILPISVVFPAQTLDKASWIFFSVFVSKAEVASSNKTKTGVWNDMFLIISCKIEL